MHARNKGPAASVLAGTGKSSMSPISTSVPNTPAQFAGVPDINFDLQHCTHCVKVRLRLCRILKRTGRKRPHSGRQSVAKRAVGFGKQLQGAKQPKWGRNQALEVRLVEPSHHGQLLALTSPTISNQEAFQRAMGMTFTDLDQGNSADLLTWGEVGQGGDRSVISVIPAF